MLPQKRFDEFRTPNGLRRVAFEFFATVEIIAEAMTIRDLKVVARDGIEPPTPAFSGLRSTD
jgi:hypothetical protein